ncbi:MAG: beta-glucuronidase [Clostridia bacterium]|nr:beta-glucuronidase [Clostridia bacterium]
MLRLFAEHHVRRELQLAPVWTMTTLDEGGLDAPVRVSVPSVWESIPGLRTYKGRAAYENRFVGGGTLRFVFGGVSFMAKVYLDGELLAEHYGAYTAFDVIARDVPQGEHVLRVEADNRYGEASALHVENDYYSYGGINRPVGLQQLRRAYIEQLRIVTKREGGEWKGYVTVSVRSLCGEDVTVSVKLSAADGGVYTAPVTLEAGGRCGLSECIELGDVTPWSPERPQLYLLQAELAVDGALEDDLIDRFGCREVTLQGRRLCINGESVRIKGFNRHEDYGALGSAVPVEVMTRDLQMMRDMGANAVRTCHYPNDPRFLDLCDEMGMLVWEESHARGLTLAQMQHPLFAGQTEQCVREMIAQHVNHPSIVIWGCLNECDDITPEGAAIYRWNLDLLRRLDSSRPVTAALLDRKGSLIFADCDIASVNLYPLWYHPTDPTLHVKNMAAYVEANGGAGKPVIVSEIGAGAIYGYRDPGAMKWTEERQAQIIARQIDAVLSHPDCAGIFLWQFADVRVDESWFDKRPGCINNKGVVSQYRRPKLSYQTVKECFARY